jgi:hypothetical protein
MPYLQHAFNPYKKLITLTINNKRKMFTHDAINACRSMNSFLPVENDVPISYKNMTKDVLYKHPNHKINKLKNRRRLPKKLLELQIRKKSITIETDKQAEKEIVNINASLAAELHNPVTEMPSIANRKLEKPQFRVTRSHKTITRKHQMVEYSPEPMPTVYNKPHYKVRFAGVKEEAPVKKEETTQSSSLLDIKEVIR